MTDLTHQTALWSQYRSCRSSTNVRLGTWRRLTTQSADDFCGTSDGLMNPRNIVRLLCQRSACWYDLALIILCNTAGNDFGIGSHAEFVATDALSTAILIVMSRLKSLTAHRWSAITRDFTSGRSQDDISMLFPRALHLLFSYNSANSASPEPKYFFPIRVILRTSLQPFT